MLSSAKKKALVFIAATLVITLVLAYSIAQQNVTYYYTIQEVLARPEAFADKDVRILGFVEPGSLQFLLKDNPPETKVPKVVSEYLVKNPNNPLQFTFTIADEAKDTMQVLYSGVKPDLFKEGQGVVVNGKLLFKDAAGSWLFNADTLLVKHSEDYKVDPTHQQKKEDYYKTLQP